MILKSHNERQSYGPDNIVPPARQPTDIRQSNNQFFPSENLDKSVDDAQGTNTDPKSTPYAPCAQVS
jgi:hypothetical protein